MDFVDVGYSFLMPLIIILNFILPPTIQQYNKAILKSINVSLLFYFLFQCWDYYNLYKLAAIFGIEITPKGLWLLMQTNLVAAIKNILLLIFPLVLVFKKPSESFILSIIMLLLFWYDAIFAVVTNTSYSFPFQIYKPLILYVAKYVCLIITVYSFLWLRKKHLFQQRL